MAPEDVQLHADGYSTKNTHLGYPKIYDDVSMQQQKK